MWLRRMARAALIVVPLALNPMLASAQGQGQERANEARVQASAVGQTNDNGRVITELTSGIARVFASLPLPPGIARRFQPPAEPEPEPQPEPQPEPEPEPEFCDTTLWTDPATGVTYVKDCHGNLTPLFGG